MNTAKTKDGVVVHYSICKSDDGNVEVNVYKDMYHKDHIARVLAPSEDEKPFDTARELIGKMTYDQLTIGFKLFKALKGLA